MRGTNCADISVETFATTAEMPAEVAGILGAQAGFFGARAWWDVVLSAAMPDEAHAVFVAAMSGRRCLSVMPMQSINGRLAALTTPYSCSYHPLFANDLAADARVAAVCALAGFMRRDGAVRLDALPCEWAGLGDLEAGIGNAGLMALRFDHFGNWHEDVEGLGWDGYLARRPGALRETVKRRLRRASKLTEARFEILRDPDEMDRAVGIFEAVYALSWKDAEPFPTFNASLIRMAAEKECLRLGIWWKADVAVAVQFWVITGNTALVLKLAHDERFKAESPGTVLTSLMLRYFLDEERVSEIDFGRGDDSYKQGWAAQRRRRIGLLVANPRTPRGLLAIARHGAGRLRAAMK